jgi:hypothetical protein
VSDDLSKLLGKLKEEQKQLKQKGRRDVKDLAFAATLCDEIRDTETKEKKLADASYYAAASSSQYEEFVCTQRCPG